MGSFVRVADRKLRHGIHSSKAMQGSQQLPIELLCPFEVARTIRIRGFWTIILVCTQASKLGTCPGPVNLAFDVQMF